VPDIGFFHPQIVHFVVALLGAGVVGRWLWLTGRVAWAGPAATTLILAGTLAAVVAVKSGDDAHGPAERVPGARTAVVNHEEWGKRTRNLFLIVAAIEVGALALARREKARKAVLLLSALAGTAGLWVLYEAAEHGGEVVYAYAGGVGIRSGQPEDVGRLLTAGLYHQAMADRAAGRHEDAARLIDELARRHPDDVTVRLLVAESSIEDRRDGRAALATLAAIPVPADDARLAVRAGVLTARAYVVLGVADSARLVAQGLSDRYAGSPAVRALLEELR
jgi:uncharacterized membrane protein